MTKAGCILIMVVFIIESLIIIPLLWTIPGFINISKILNGKATEANKITAAVLGIIFGAILGIIGGIFILVELNSDKK